MKTLLCLLSCVFINDLANADLVTPAARVYKEVYGLKNLSVTSIGDPTLTIFRIPVNVFEDYERLPKNAQGEGDGILGKRISYLVSISMYVGALGTKFSEATIDGLEIHNVR